MIKTTNITPPLIRKVTPPTELYKNPPKVSPMILAKPPKLLSTTCKTTNLATNGTIGQAG
jgi:hypothetical protein